APTIPDDMLYEVVDGQVVEKKMSARETEIASILVGLLTSYLRTNRLGKVVGEMLFRISPENDLRRRPDVAFVSHARWPFNRRVPKVTPWDMVPDLAIEVISESNSAYEVLEKVNEYFAAGVSRVWVVYPDQAQVYLYASPTQIQVLKIGQELDGGDLLPGFHLPVAALFEDDPE
ncbi:MAG: Uma2 family endonuclease, partial [Isosphaeraceae bacterium]